MKRQGRKASKVIETVPSTFSFAPAALPQSKETKDSSLPYFRLPVARLRDFVLGNLAGYLPADMSIIPKHQPEMVRIQGGGSTFRVWVRQNDQTGLVDIPPETISEMVMDLVKDGRATIADFVYSDENPPKSLEGFVPSEVNMQGLKLIRA